MSRYLTPSRICLLILIEIYISGRVTISHKLKLLQCIANHIDPYSEDIASPTELAEELLRTNQDVHYFRSILSTWTTVMPGRDVYDIFLERLWSIDNLDSLHCLLDAVVELLQTSEAPPDPTHTKISRASPLGQYIRRCSIEFTKLAFPQSQSLWHALSVYRAVSKSHWLSKRADASSFSSDKENFLLDNLLTSDDQTGPAPGDSLGDDDYDRLVTFSLEHLQRLGGRLDANVIARLRYWIHHQRDINKSTLVHFIAFFDNWRAGQYSMAIESLHRYFDYSLNAQTENDNMRVHYQYALLHLSVLHADFDCWGESIDAMEECIATARENQDTVCLNYALSWLLYLRQASSSSRQANFKSLETLFGGTGAESDEITFLKAKAKEMKHWSLLSSTLLEEAKLEMRRGGDSARAMEHIMQSAYLTVQHDLQFMMPTTILFQSAYFTRLGQSHLSSRMCESLALLYRQNSPIHDRIRATCRLAYVLAQSGDYGLAHGMIDALGPDVKGLLKHQQRVTAFKMYLELCQSMRRGTQYISEPLLAQLRTYRSFGDPEISSEIDLIEIEYLIRVGDLDAAWTTIHKQLTFLDQNKNADTAQRMQLLVARARLLVLAGQAPKAFSSILRMASAAMNGNVMSVLAEAIQVLCMTLSDLGEYSAARDLAQALFPHVLEGSDCNLLAELYITAAEACVGSAGRSCEMGSSEQKEQMHLAQTFAESSRKVFGQLDDQRGTVKSLVVLKRLATWHGDKEAVEKAEEMLKQVVIIDESTEVPSVDQVVA